MSLIEDWANSYGSTGYEGGYGIATDSNGNVYLTGLFDGSMNVGSYTLASNSGSYDIFVIKLDTGGNVEWAKNYGSANYDDGYAIATDSSDNVYLTGQFYGSMNVGSISTLTSNGGYSDIFVMKLDSDGIEKWAKNYGSTSTTSTTVGGGIATDSSGNVYLTGFFNSSMNVGSYTLASNGGSYDIFVIKLDTYGDEKWAKSYGTANNDYGFGIATDSYSNVYLTGEFSGSMNVGSLPNSPLISINASPDVFVMKLDTSGDVQWANSYGSTSSDTGYGIATDNTGNVYLTGHFDISMNVGSYTLASNGSNDIFVIKLDTGGNVQWANSYGSTSSDTGNRIATDNTGNVYLTGYFDISMNVGSYTLASNGSNDIFVIKLDTGGNVQWANSYGSTSSDTGDGIATDSNGNVYLTGLFDGSMNVGSYTLASNGGSNDIFVMKLIQSSSSGSGTGGSPSSGTVTSQICFLAGTPVLTDQGEIPIEKINSSIHSIYGRPIRAITQTITTDPCLVCFESNSLGMNIPSEKTIMSLEHKILYNNQLISARNFINENEGIYTVPYKKEILYNVLMDNYERIKVNNLICETLHPKNKVAKLYKRLENASTENYESIIKEFNNLNQSKRNRFKLKF